MQKSQKGATWFSRVHSKSTPKRANATWSTRLISALSRWSQETTHREPTGRPPWQRWPSCPADVSGSVFSNWSFLEDKDQDNQGTDATWRGPAWEDWDTEVKVNLPFTPGDGKSRSTDLTEPVLQQMEMLPSWQTSPTQRPESRPEVSR